MSERPVLAVDLDRSLLKSDVLYESLWQHASASLRAFPELVLKALAGKARLKRYLAENVRLDPAGLAYNQPVLDYIGRWKQDGGSAVLVTATDQQVARSIGDHVGLFDEVFGSDGVVNLKGSAKADFLVRRYGAGNYDYVGDAQSDIPVWRSARRAISVDTPDSLRRRIGSQSGEVIHLGQPQASWRPYARTLRPHQWSKNLLIFLPLLAAHDMALHDWLVAICAFVVFSLVASSVYILNDLLDLSADRAHARKRNRPLASGAIPLEHGTLLAPGLLVAALVIALATTSLDFILVLLLYYALTMAYSFYLKRKLVIDICTLAGLYTIRILAGAAATHIPLSVWLLAFSIFFFLSLAAVKRQGELVDATSSGKRSASGRAYRSEDTPIVAMMAMAAGYMSVLVMALYINSPVVQTLYARPEVLWGLCPILLFWVSRMVMITHRGRMHDDPIVFASHDRVSYYSAGLMALVLAAGVL